ncbi:uncharacterized protein LOC120008703 [Tripterygium wilfordii]|uniref:uncharacterized protein LOC120008703 n=1 Tax=Tripterygium wilfordii TaxID=458696 RepID=UPI0018F7EFB3|nr:uncharacterized protein LOC120008703 [Tripterygium wilfordii]
MDQEVNPTFIALIPKSKEAFRVSDYRPISLCNVLYKIIAKLLAVRLNNILHHIVVGNQSAFIKNRLKCISSVSYSVVINGHKSTTFFPERGIRQGDPLSPLLFVLCTEALSSRISQAETRRYNWGFPFGNGSVTRLIFQKHQCSFARIHIILLRSRFCYPLECKRRILMKDISSSLQLLVGKKKAFQFVVDKMDKKANNWNSIFLPFAAKEVMLKSILQAIPMYSMQLFKFPASLCANLDHIVRKLWWGST